MSHTASGIARNQKWYNKNIFPLVPLLSTTEENGYRTSKFKFRWLFITIWSIDYLGFKLSVTFDFNYRFGLKGSCFYLMWSLLIPFPKKLNLWWDKLTTRRSKVLIHTNNL